jgi:hypothetical protein
MQLSFVCRFLLIETTQPSCTLKRWSRQAQPFIVADEDQAYVEEPSEPELRPFAPEAMGIGQGQSEEAPGI